MLEIDLKFDIGKNKLEFTKDQKELIRESSNSLLEILNSRDFENEVIRYSWKGKEGFNHTKDSNSVIYKKILSGDDKFVDKYPDDQNQLGDNDLDVWVIPYKAKRNKVGKTYKGTYKSWININNLNYRMNKYKNNPQLLHSLVSQNIIHEYCHNLGYEHIGNERNKNNNIYSVPYAIGGIVKNLLTQKLFKDLDSKTWEDFEKEEYDCDFNMED
ncbi:hypothetical protein [Flagellimonas sp. S3867]|uniref:hypothetical protein n=1 Tax=Flagellimonas sp. S3867 TaxID=2768063 RepID=UPI0016888F25|nr:hypothetical protein [Flagellimonas sp. S3867]